MILPLALGLAALVPTPADTVTAGTLSLALTAGADTVDALVSPAWAAGVLLWAPIDMAVLFNWPWNERRSPADRYARAPATDTAVIWRWVDTAPARVEWTDEAADAPEPR